MAVIPRHWAISWPRCSICSGPIREHPGEYRHRPRFGPANHAMAEHGPRSGNHGVVGGRPGPDSRYWLGRRHLRGDDYAALFRLTGHEGNFNVTPEWKSEL